MSKPTSKDRVKLKPSTFKNFDLNQFKEEKLEMEQFRKNTHGEAMEDIFNKIQDEYLPDDITDGVFSKHTVDTEGNVTNETLFISSDDDERIFMQEPLIAIKVHTALSILTQRSPEVRWDSDNELYDDRVPVIDAMRKKDWDDHDSRQQYVLLWFYFFLYGVTFWRRWFRKEERTVHLPVSIDLANDEVITEPKKVVEFDATSGEAMGPMEVLIDPATESFRPSSMRKCIFTKVYNFDRFTTLFKGISPAKNFNKIVPTTADGRQGTKWVTVDFYENKDLDLLFIVANGLELLKDHLPQNHKQLSIMMTQWMPRKDPKNPYGLGPIEMMLPDKKLMDEFKSMTLTQLKFSIYKSVFYTGMLEGEGEGGDIRIRPDRAYKTSNPKDIMFYDMPGPGAEAFKGLDLLRARTDDASGINKPLGGDIVKTTAFQTDLAKDAALARLFVPINNIVGLLERDAQLTFELQKQHLSLPDVEELLDPDDIEAAFAEMEEAKASGKADFDIFIDVDEEGQPKVFKAQFRTVQLNVDKGPDGSPIPARGKQDVVVTPDLFDWKGKIRVVQDTLFSITPTVERTRKMELYNLLIPLFGQPPQLVAKVAQKIIRLYGEDADDVLPDSWIQFLKASEDGTIGQPQTPGADIPPSAEELGRPEGRPREFGTAANEALTFEQQGANKVVTNIGGQKDAISAQSQAINPS